MQAQEKGNMDTDMNLDLMLLHYRAVDQERTVVACMDTHLEAVDIHKVEEGKGTDKENSQALPLMEVLELLMKMKPPLWMIWKMAFALCLMVVERENRDKEACRKERACNKDTDKDIEDIHRNRKNQGEQKELNL